MTLAPVAALAISSAALVVCPSSSPLKELFSGLLQSIKILLCHGECCLAKGMHSFHGMARKQVWAEEIASAWLVTLIFRPVSSGRLAVSLGRLEPTMTV